MKRSVCASLLLVIVACSSGSPEPDSDGAWVGTITTEGNVTTVVNESGSVWGGTATLVEEASIGVEIGADEYMLGSVAGVASTDDRIFVIDRQIPAVRIYDHNGSYIGDLGGEGAGPGEYGAPDSIAIIPDGRIFLWDRRPGRITAFLPDGSVEATYQAFSTLSAPVSMVVTPDGVPYLPKRVSGNDPSTLVLGMTPYARDGPAGDPIVPPQFADEVAWLVAYRDDGSVRSRTIVPFVPTYAWVMAPTGAMIAGMASEYRFEIHRPDGQVIVAIREREPVPVLDDEAAWHERRTIAWFHRNNPDWTWNGPAIPDAKPPFTAFVPSQSGEVWVLGPGPGKRTAECTEDPRPGEPVVRCWTDSQTVDVFDADGRYLGDVALPAGFRLRERSWIDDRTVIAVVEDDAGTIMVKRYRLVLPSEEGR